MKIDLYTLSGIQSIYDVEDAYEWCYEKFGPPRDGGWAYGRTNGAAVYSVYAIETITFDHDIDAMLFLLKYQ